MKEKGREWGIRMKEELRQGNRQMQFITLTFSEDALKKYMDKANTKNEKSNDIAKIAVRQWLERIRKQTGKSVKHWLVTECGHKGTERLHIHGITWSNWTKEELEKSWSNGWVYIGNYCNEKTINYIIKYVSKQDQVNKEFHAKILCSPGIGKGYEKRPDAKIRNKYRGAETDTSYINTNGTKVPLPTYYKRKLYTDEERETIWTGMTAKGLKYINGQLYWSYERELYYNGLETAQYENTRKGFGHPKNLDQEWKDKKLEMHKLEVDARKTLSGIWKDQYKNVILQNNYNNSGHGTEKTNQRRGNEDGIFKLPHESEEARNVVPATGRLFDYEDLCNRKKPVGRLWNETERHRDFNRWDSARENADNMDREHTNNDTINSKMSQDVHRTIMGQKSENKYQDIRTCVPTRRLKYNMEICGKQNKIHECRLFQHCDSNGEWDSNTKRENRSTYECVDVDTGEMFKGGLKNKNYKTLYYEKRSKKITNPDGTKKIIWETIRYVSKCGQTEIQF